MTMSMIEASPEGHGIVSSHLTVISPATAAGACTCLCGRIITAVSVSPSRVDKTLTRKALAHFRYIQTNGGK